MHGLDHDEHSANGFSSSRTKKRIAFILLAGFTAGLGIFFVLRLQAAAFTYVYPPDKNILVSRSFEPDAFSAVSDGGTITVTIDITNSENVALRGFYYSDQVPNGWVVNTAGVTVNGSSIADYTYGQGYADEVYTGFTPHRWALEMPQGNGVFSPTHPISASSGTAQIVYTMIVSGGTGSDYAIGYEAWAGWLETSPTGTAVFGYQTITSTLNADFSADPRAGVAPLTVTFTDLSAGDITTWTWNFGDGTTAQIQSPTHVYNQVDRFTVSLTVSNAADSAIVVKPDFITVTAPSLQANFTAQPRFGLPPLTVQFTDLSVGEVLTRVWYFGDVGTITSSLLAPTHTYNALGYYTVSLTVQDAYASSVLARPRYIHVTDEIYNAYLPVILKDYVPQH